MATFSIKAAPNTDIWRKPPSWDVFNAPAAAPPGAGSTKAPLSSFASVQASVSASWTELYDQGGILLSFRRAGTDPAAPPQKWIKAGIEFYNGKPVLSVVACDAWADWSVSPHPSHTSAAEVPSTKTWTTLLAQKEGDSNPSIWIYHVLENGEKVPLREICWVFGDSESWELEVLAMAARPEKNATSDLEVEVKDFEVKWSK